MPRLKSNRKLEKASVRTTWPHRYGQAQEKLHGVRHPGLVVKDGSRYFARRPRVRVLYTPAHASWLNAGRVVAALVLQQSELDRFDYQSPVDICIEHLTLSWPEYNRRFVNPL